MAGHVFISYQHSDRSYVDKLAAFLRQEQIPVWYDFSLVPGDRFPAVIQQRIDECFALIVVLTPEAAASEWVLDELSYARARHKLVLPLQLRETTDLIQLIALQRESVLGGRMPSATLVERLRGLMETGQGRAAPASGATEVANRADEIAQRLESSSSWLPRCSPFETGYPKDSVDAFLRRLSLSARLGELQAADVDDCSAQLAPRRSRLLRGEGYPTDAVDSLLEEIRTAVLAWRRGG